MQVHFPWSRNRETFHFSTANISEGQSSLPFSAEFPTLILHKALLLYSIICLGFCLFLEASRDEVLTTTQNSWGFPQASRPAVVKEQQLTEVVQVSTFYPISTIVQLVCEPNYNFLFTSIQTVEFSLNLYFDKLDICFSLTSSEQLIISFVNLTLD